MILLLLQDVLSLGIALAITYLLLLLVTAGLSWPIYKRGEYWPAPFWFMFLIIGLKLFIIGIK